MFIEAFISYIKEFFHSGASRGEWGNENAKSELCLAEKKILKESRQFRALGQKDTIIKLWGTLETSSESETWQDV